MFKYSIEEVPENREAAHSNKGLDEAGPTHCYKLELEPEQTIISYGKLKEFKFYGCEAIKELDDISSEIIEIILEDFDYANGKVRAITAKTLEATCPHCNQNMHLSSWRWKAYCDKSSQLIIIDPAEAMSVHLERDYCLNRLRTCRGVDIVKYPTAVGTDLFRLFQAFIEGEGKQLVIRSYEDRTKTIPFDKDIVDPSEHPTIYYQNNGTVRFGSMTKNLKTLYSCSYCGEVFFVIYNPSESDKESISRFQLEDHIPKRLATKIAKDRNTVSFTLLDQDNDTQRLYQWNHETGDFLIDGQTLVFNEKIKLDVKTIIRPVPAQAITKMTLRNNGIDLDAGELDQANYFTIRFPDAIPDFLEFASTNKPGIQVSLDNIRAIADNRRPKSLLDSLIDLSLANRFQGYPIKFFRVVWPGRDHREKAFSELARIFYDCKALPVRFEEACFHIKDMQPPERGLTADGYPMPRSYLMRILERAEEIFDTN